MKQQYFYYNCPICHNEIPDTQTDKNYFWRGFCSNCKDWISLTGVPIQVRIIDSDKVTVRHMILKYIFRKGK